MKKYDWQIGILEFLGKFFLHAFVGITILITLDNWD